MPVSAEEVVRSAYDAFSRRDPDALVELADPQVEIHTVTGMLVGREEPYKGYQGLREYLRDVSETWDEIELLTHEVHQVSDAKVIVFGRVRARRELAVIDAPNAWLWEVADGRIRSVRVFGDPQAARELVG